jgi:hypothetical protein
MQLFFVILHDAVPPTSEGRASLSNKLINQLKLDSAAVEQIFKKLPVIIRRNISRVDAEKYVELLESLGASAEALPEVELASNSSEEEIRDKDSQSPLEEETTAKPSNEISFTESNIEPAEQNYEDTEYSLPQTPSIDDDEFSLDFSDNTDTLDPFTDDTVPSADDIDFSTEDQPFDLDSGSLGFSDELSDSSTPPNADNLDFDDFAVEQNETPPPSDSDPLDYSIPFADDSAPSGEIWDQGLSEHLSTEDSSSAEVEEQVATESNNPTFEYATEARQEGTEAGFREPEDSRPVGGEAFSPISEIDENQISLESGDSLESGAELAAGTLTSAVSDKAFASHIGDSDEWDSTSLPPESEIEDVNISDELQNDTEEKGVPLGKLVGGFVVIGAALLFTLNAIFPGAEDEIDEAITSVDQKQIASMLQAQKEILSEKPDPEEDLPKKDVIADWSGELQENGVYTRVSMVTVNGAVAGMAIEIKTDDIGPPSDEEVVSGQYQPWLKRFYAEAVAPVPSGEAPEGSRRRLKGKGRAYLVYGLTRERAIFEIHVAAPDARDGEPLEGVWLIEEGELPEGEENLLLRTGENSYAIRLSGRFSALPVIKTPEKAESESTPTSKTP